LPDTPEVLVLGAQRVHERIGIFRRDILISVQMESNGLKCGLIGVMDNRRPRRLQGSLCALRRQAYLFNPYPVRKQ
jgi:hypothetical protein